MFRPLRWLLGKLAIRKARRVRAEFAALADRPREAQHARLFAQLQREKDTAFGRDHGFRDLKTLEDFRRRMPIARYEYYTPYVRRVMAGETEAMFHRQRIRMFAMTSGTTDSRKYVPVTDRFLADYRRGWLIWGVHMYEEHPELWFKPMLQLVSDWQEEFTKAGIPCGSISGLTTQMQMRVVRKTYVLPPESGRIKDVRAKYYLAWRLGLVRDLGVMLSANPSTFVSLAKFGGDRAADLVRDIRDGTIHPDFSVPDAVRAAERHRLLPNPERAKELDAILSRTGTLRPMDVWPNLGLIGNWTGGSVGGYLRHYPDYYGDKPKIRDLGLVASEGRMTIPIASGTPGGILDIGSAFFEFVPVAEIDSPHPVALESHELEVGKDYYILLTTSSGFYRYNIFDVVRVLGWHSNTPILAFLNKGSYISNLTGEKLSEFQAVQAVEAACTATGRRLTSFSMAPVWDEEVPYYGLFVESGDFPDENARREFIALVERKLQEGNDEYDTKRSSHRLQPARLMTLASGFWQQWDRARLVKAGGTAEQYKHPCLIPDLEFAKSVSVQTAIRAAAG